MEVKVLGKCSDSILNDFQAQEIFVGLKANEVILFCDYSNFNIPIYSRFNSVRLKDEIIITDVSINLKEVSQQFFKTYNMIPIGWKTLCRFEFNDEEKLKEIVDILPEISGWDFSDGLLFFNSSNSQ